MSFGEQQRTVRRQLDAEIKAKDAEIERLKAELQQSRKLCQIWIDKSAGETKLITELADALESIPATSHWDWSVKLIQRAREATK